MFDRKDRLPPVRNLGEDRHTDVRIWGEVAAQSATEGRNGRQTELEDEVWSMAAPNRQPHHSKAVTGFVDRTSVSAVTVLPGWFEEQWMTVL